MNAMSWFIDCTYLGEDKESVDRIFDECMSQGFIPLIDYHPKYGWVFHTLFPPDGTVSKKNISQLFYGDKKKVAQSERDLEDELCLFLDNGKIPYRRQVSCLAGIADVVTSTHVFEIKLNPSRDELFKAIGQVLVYRQAINPDLRAGIIANKIGRDVAGIAQMAMELGVSIWLLNDGDSGPIPFAGNSGRRAA